MLNYIWVGMLITGFIFAVVNGRVDYVAKALMDSAGNAVKLCIDLLGVMCLWTGMMNIAEKSGFVISIGRAVKPLIRILFPSIPEKHPASGAVVMNLVANFLGLGNAATPLGLKAMNELQKLNVSKDTASDAMSMFLVLNTSALQLIPATVIALRSAAGSAEASSIMGPIWFATLCAFFTGVISAKILSGIYNKKSLNKARTNSLRYRRKSGGRKNMPR